ncbi:predicted protein [Sclerotinia sclerotiorum 1980 UF-70]|uniref:Calcineurin-like phosphoesterase domain-containing protein n=2 Tax=Sclerotinia sclerotiorum (strain ATCC 18683 / 1980 / Ss-1) TaxID=665079 RepID=A7E8F1_SCLS1|nr:predicted protein [Sclerotinia sclerotiorum 1980 UF-70]APA06007.1 hypothetical protein sscle_01g007770 [Sclerotinia sclerotiorum 1980 UF-70]EDN96653.1 predicted protein [Sclerotinia sclerotiorum 1980 UF-70]
MSSTKIGPQKRKTRTWDPSPAINIDILSLEDQEPFNQNRPKRVKRHGTEPSGFVLDYTRSRQMALKNMGKGKPFTDEADIERRQSRPLTSLRPTPLIPWLVKDHAPIIPKEGATVKPPEKPPLAPTGGLRPPSGGIAQKRKSKVAQPSRSQDFPNIDFRVPMAAGNIGWAMSLAVERQRQVNISAGEAISMYQMCKQGELLYKFEKEFCQNSLYKDKGEGNTGHVHWFIHNLARKQAGVGPRPYNPPTEKQLEALNEMRNTKEGREKIIANARAIGEKNKWIKPGKLESLIDRSFKSKSRSGAPVTTEMTTAASTKSTQAQTPLPWSKTEALAFGPATTTVLSPEVQAVIKDLIKSLEKEIPITSVPPKTKSIPGSISATTHPRGHSPGQATSVDDYVKDLAKQLSALPTTKTKDESQTQTQITQSVNLLGATVTVTSSAATKTKGSSAAPPQKPKGAPPQGIEDVITPMLEGTIINTTSSVDLGSVSAAVTTILLPAATTAPTTTAAAAAAAATTRAARTAADIEKVFGKRSNLCVPPPTLRQNIGFHYVSDLHLEQTSYDNFDFTPSVGYLVLAGDIGWAHSSHEARYRKLLARMCAKPKIKRIFLVAGNRDFWPIHTNTVQGALGVMRKFAAHPDMNGKLTFLEDESFVIEENGGKIVVLGCTLWTETRRRGGGEPRDQDNAQRTARHRASCEWIRQETAKIRNDPKEVLTRILIITHMPPSKSGTSDPTQTAIKPRDFTSGSMHGSDVIDGCKAKNYDHSMIKTTMPQLDSRDVWIWGHTHWNEPVYGRVRHGGMRFESNQRGNATNRVYHPRPIDAFQPNKVIWV